MALTVSSNFEDIEIIIPAATGNKTVTLTVPQLDCMQPADVTKINAMVQEDDTIRGNGTEVLRFMLKYYNTSKTAGEAIDKLVPRQMNEIDKYWQEKSEMTVGESSPSTDS